MNNTVSTDILLHEFTFQHNNYKLWLNTHLPFESHCFITKNDKYLGEVVGFDDQGFKKLDQKDQFVMDYVYIIENCHGNSYGDDFTNSYGDGNNSGYGNGYGSGYGFSYGYNKGSGNGSGYGSGYGSSNNYGYGNGSGYGSAYPNGDGDG